MERKKQEFRLLIDKCYKNVLSDFDNVYLSESDFIKGLKLIKFDSDKNCFKSGDYLFSEDENDDFRLYFIANELSITYEELFLIAFFIKFNKRKELRYKIENSKSLNDFISNP